MKSVLNLFTFCFLVISISGFCNSDLNDVQGQTTSLGNEPMKVKIIILNPKGRTLPDFSNLLIRDIADYAATFFINGMTQQGYVPKSNDIFELNKKGEVKIYESNSPLDMFELVAIKNKKKHAYDHIKGEKPLFENAVWWVFSNITDEVKYGFTGGGNVNLGTSIANLPQSYKQLTTDMDLGSSGYFTENKMKAVVHELGHALQLPHNGPIPANIGKDPNGNTLMGPIIRAFKKKYDSTESRVYLSKLSAAMLWKHPVFNNTSYIPHKNPSIIISDISVSFDSIKNNATVKGKIETNLKYHSVTLIDVSKKPKRRSKNGNTSKAINPSYQDRGYVAIIDNSGNFSFNVDKMISKQGHFLITICFNNGLITSKVISSDDVKKHWKTIEYNFLYPQ